MKGCIRIGPFRQSIARDELRSIIAKNENYVLMGADYMDGEFVMYHFRDSSPKVTNQEEFDKAFDEAYGTHANPAGEHHLITLPEGMKIDVDKLEAEVKRGITSIGRNKDIPHECICSRDQVVHFGCKCGGV